MMPLQIKAFFVTEVSKIKFVVTVWVNSRHQKTVFGQGSAPDPAWGWGSHNTPQYQTLYLAGDGLTSPSSRPP